MLSHRNFSLIKLPHNKFFFALLVFLGLVCTVISCLYLIRQSYIQLGDFPRYQYDDSYITYRYAHNLVYGSGFRFNLSDNSNSATAQIYALALAGIHILLGKSFPDAANFINISMLVASCSVIYLHIVSIFRNIVGLLVGFITAYVYASIGLVNFWLFSGMESISYISLILIFSLFPFFYNLKFDSWKTSSKIAFLFLGSLTSIFRLEAFPLVLISTTLYFFISQIHIKKILAYISILVTPFFLQLLFWKIYYGDLIPEPIRYKSLCVFYMSSVLQNFNSLIAFYKANATLSFLFLFSVLVQFTYLILRKYDLSKLIFSLTVIITSNVLLLFVAFSDLFRYQLLLYPVIFSSIIFLFRIFLVPYTSNSLFVVFFSILILFTSTKIINEQKTLFINAYTSQQWWAYIQNSRIQAGEWLETNTPKNSRVLAADLGAIAYYNPSNVIIDGAGLVNESLLDVIEKSESYSEYMQKSEIRYLVDGYSPNQPKAIEFIMNGLSGFYDPLKTRVYSTCSFEELFKLRELKTFPENLSPDEEIVRYSIWEVTINKNC
jgi:hypothetical protein